MSFRRYLENESKLWCGFVKNRSSKDYPAQLSENLFRLTIKFLFKNFNFLFKSPNFISFSKVTGFELWSIQGLILPLFSSSGPLLARSIFGISATLSDH